MCSDLKSQWNLYNCSDLTDSAGVRIIRSRDQVASSSLNPIVARVRRELLSDTVDQLNLRNFVNRCDDVRKRNGDVSVSVV